MVSGGCFPVMVNQHRLAQLTGLMSERGWDHLILYGHAWRKDHFRCLVNVNFSGTHAAAMVSRSGAVRCVVSDPWDAEAMHGIETAVSPDFGKGLSAAVSGPVAIAGMELMEARFVQAL